MTVGQRRLQAFRAARARRYMWARNIDPEAVEQFEAQSRERPPTRPLPIQFADAAGDIVDIVVDKF
jgi:hypothetical protein